MVGSLTPSSVYPRRRNNRFRPAREWRMHVRLAVLTTGTFWTFLREFSPFSPTIARNSGSNSLGLRLVSIVGIAEDTTAAMIEA